MRNVARLSFVCEKKARSLWGKGSLGQAVLVEGSITSKLTTNGKAARVLRFLMGARNPRIRQQLQPYGFGEPQLEQGWVLLRHVAEVRGTYQPRIPKDPTITNACDDWRSRWFAIAQASLRRNYPAVETWLFNGLQAGQADLSTVTVPLFVERVRQLSAADAPVADAKAARDLLTQRGLTDAVLAMVDPWVAQLAKFAGELPPPPVPTETESAAQDALWNWYLEWSGIVRAAIQDRSLLRELGFLKQHRSAPAADPAPTPTNTSPNAEPAKSVVPTANDPKTPKAA